MGYILKFHEAGVDVFNEDQYIFSVEGVSNKEQLYRILKNGNAVDAMIEIYKKELVDTEIQIC